MSDSFDVDTSPVVVAVRSKKSNTLDRLLIGAAAVALAGVAFAGGRLTVPAVAGIPGNNADPGANVGPGGPGGAPFGPGSSFRPDSSFQPGSAGLGGTFGGAGGGVSLTGSVVEVSATQFTIQLTNGTTVSIPIDTGTTYHTQSSASSADVKTGSKVQVQVSGGGVRGPLGGGTPGSPGPNASGIQSQLGTASSITIIP